LRDGDKAQATEFVVCVQRERLSKEDFGNYAKVCDSLNFHGKTWREESEEVPPLDELSSSLPFPQDMHNICKGRNRVAESLGIKNYKWDKQDKYWVPEGRNCYTSYFFLPDDEEVSVIEKMQLHGKEFVENLDGGSACHINLKEHLSYEQYRKLLEVAGTIGTNYFTFNVKNTECRDCGYISKHTLEECPICGSKNLDYWTRIIGYLVKVKNFSEGRQFEEGKRVYE
jgi:anaerobic ribonucleoside-triphosphate reductase